MWRLSAPIIRRSNRTGRFFDWLSRNEENVKNYIEDPLCGFTFTVNGFQTLFQLIWNLHDRKKLQEMPQRLPVLFISGEEDPVGDYGKSVLRVYQSFREAGMEKCADEAVSGGSA